MRFIISFLLLICVAFQAYAAPKTAEVTVNQDNIKQLIQTLESETARTEFINNLKTLQKSQSGSSAADEVENDPSIVLSEEIGLDTQTKDFFVRYHEFLAKNNLNATMVGKWAMTLGAAIISFVLIFVAGQGSIFIRRKLTRFAGFFSVRHTNRFRIYVRIIKYYGYYLIFTLFLYALSVIWGFSDTAFFKSEISARIFFGLMNFVLLTLVAALVGELVNGALEYGMRRASHNNAQRLSTFLPIIRNLIFIIFFVVFGFVLLSSLGINVIPLLAGAGFVGVAIGIGAQKFLQDFLNGFTIILEDLFHVGDVVTVSGITGVVETVSLRKVQLRSYDGIVVTVPFSEIKIVQNLTKEYSYFAIELAVSYREDTDRVIEAMRDVADEMQKGEFKDVILEPIEIAGVERFGETGVIIKARLKTRPGQQWGVGYEYKRNVKKLFDKRGIQTPLPYQTVIISPEQDKTDMAKPDKPASKDNIQPQE